MVRVLFPDPFVITQVAAVRALGRRGDVCEVAWPYGAIKKRLRSRYVREVYPTADIVTRPGDFADDVVQLCRKREFDVVLPVSIESTEALLAVRPELEKQVATLLPTPEQLATGANKSKTYEFCSAIELPHPRTSILRDEDDARRFASEADYPLVLKHTRNFGGSRGVRFVGDGDELATAYRQLANMQFGGPEILVQEYVPGLLFDAVTVAKDGVCPRIFTSVRKLMYPVSGGVTCISVSTWVPELQEAVSHALAVLRWNGPVEMEFKLDSRDGKFKLIEINPRFWASIDSAIRCGVNFPAIAVDLALGLDVAEGAAYESGVRHKYVIDRVPYAYWQWIRSRGLSGIRDPQVYRRTTYDIDLKDPLPDLFSVLLAAKNLLSGKFPRPLSEGAKQMITPLGTEVPYIQSRNGSTEK